MSESIEFSEFFKLLNSLKEGDIEKNSILKEKMNEYKEAINSKSFLDELGQRFLHIGIEELYKYSNNENLQLISQMEKEDWEKLAEKNDFQLPQYLANAMITNIKENKLAKAIARKWDVKEREINKHIRPMAQYITEGIIEFLE